MKKILELRSRGLLTEQQILTAGRFKKNPQAFKLSPTLFRVLHDVIIKERGFEEIERQRGWSARSCKVLVSVLLYSLEECDGMVWDADEKTSDKELVEFLRADDIEMLTSAMSLLGLTETLARLFLILARSNGPASKETIHRRLYCEEMDDTPSLKSLDVMVCLLRKKLPPGMKIETIWGIGYELKSAESLKRNQHWAELQNEGHSLRKIADVFGVQASTVKRAIDNLPVWT